MRRAFITLRKPDESIKHNSNDQEPKLHERGKEIVHRRVLRRCDIKQPTFPEKVCTAYACAEPIEEALAVPERHERNRNQRGRMQKNWTSASKTGTTCGVGSTAAAPASTAKLPAKPPITMFQELRRLSHTV